MAETVMMETAVENAVHIFIVRRKEGYILCLNEYTGDCIVVLSAELLLCLTAPVRYFRNITMNITAYLKHFEKRKN